MLVGNLSRLEFLQSFNEDTEDGSHSHTFSNLSLKPCTLPRREFLVCTSSLHRINKSYICCSLEISTDELTDK